jgi:hypothetical protein
MRRYPLYSMMCNSQEVGASKAHFRLLQLQVLTARAVVRIDRDPYVPAPEA